MGSDTISSREEKETAAAAVVEVEKEFFMRFFDLLYLPFFHHTTLPRVCCFMRTPYEGTRKIINCARVQNN